MARVTRSKRHTAASERTEVSCCIKYLVFGSNALFWLLGAAFLGVGFWAWSEKQTLDQVVQATKVWLDPVVLLLIVGCVMFVIGFFGCVGALRENTVFLLIYCLSVGLILLAQIGLGIYIFVRKDGIKGDVQNFIYDWIAQYRDEDDLRDLVDAVQYNWLTCCGCQSYQDWERNIYFNCSSPSPVDACSVPWSCCRSQQAAELINRQCGQGMRRPDAKGVDTAINTIGCWQKFEDWLMRNLVPVAATVVSIALLQILGICFAQNLRHDIQAQRAKWFSTVGRGMRS